MPTLNRRHFLGSAAATLAAPALHAQGSGKPRVIVIGGGAGGATAARYIAQGSKGAIDVTLIEPSRAYFTCFFSNLYIGGFRDMAELGQTYGTLAAKYGINVVHDRATQIDRAAHTVTLAGGASLPYDRLILSPGIDFIDGAVPGWSIASQGAMPHAFKGGTQAALLRAQITAMPKGGTFAMIAPPNPYRCPPGPYERISMIAHILTQTNPTAKIIIADPKTSFSKMTLFQEGWLEHYPGMIDWIGGDFGGGTVAVDPAAMTVTIDGETLDVDACNVIPAHKAGHIAHVADLTQGNWAPVDASDMRSTVDPDIHILGDSADQGAMPKSGFAANSQAKVCANAVRADLTGAARSAAEFSNICWSLIAEENGVKIGAHYKVRDGRIVQTDGFISSPGESAEERRATFRESEGWYRGMVADMFG